VSSPRPAEQPPRQSSQPRRDRVQPRDARELGSTYSTSTPPHSVGSPVRARCPLPLDPRQSVESRRMDKGQAVLIGVMRALVLVRRSLDRVGNKLRDDQLDYVGQVMQAPFARDVTGMKPGARCRSRQRSDGEHALKFPGASRHGSPLGHQGKAVHDTGNAGTARPQAIVATVRRDPGIRPGPAPSRPESSSCMVRTVRAGPVQGQVNCSNLLKNFSRSAGRAFSRGSPGLPCRRRPVPPAARRPAHKARSPPA